MAHKAVKDGSKYFGPYYSSYSVRSTLDTLSKNFPLRTCRKKIGQSPKDRVCLNYHIGLCPGPCAGYITEEEYEKNVQNVNAFLSGRSSDIVKKLKAEMAEAAANLDFEKAAELRDRLKALETVSEKQKVELSGDSDFDIAAVCVNETDACVQVFFVRGGSILGRDFYIFEGVGNTEPEEIILSFFKQFYDGETPVPHKIYCETVLSQGERLLVEALLSERAERKVEIITPQRGEKREMAAMVLQNAELALNNYKLTKSADDGGLLKVLEKLKNIMGEESLPLRIEAFDISNQGDSEIDGSMVVFVNGKACKGEYKRFKMKTVDTRNDTASMTEMLTRRYTRLKNGDNGFEKKPDLILMDGGLGQIHAAETVLAELGCEIPILGMVKDNKHRSRGLMNSDGREFRLEDDPDLWRFITAVQNEAHRFAIEYNRKLTEKRYKKSVLDGIDGVGEKRKMALLKHFGSVAAMRKASVEEIAGVSGIGLKLAEEISEKLKGG
jgi:excinuclease ABC subunit C